ncbi:MAG: hypothetical protein ACYC3X_04240 [Pirellulaceae bacterium]
METSLHRQLKQRYSCGDAAQEVKLGEFRIDVVNPDHLVEIQHGSLAAIRNKVVRLLQDHRVLIVKPILARKLILTLHRRGGAVVSQRWSPKRGIPLDLFDELIYFTRVFPHANLTLEVPLVEVEERRYPGHGRKRWRRPNDHQVEDVRLVSVGQVFRFTTANDLQQLLPQMLPRPFHTGQLAEQLQVQRPLAQRIAYCMRKTGGAIEVGKQGNARLYQLA